MKLGLVIGQSRTFMELRDEVAVLRRVGLESVTVGEAYSFDAVSHLGALAGAIPGLEVSSGILPLFSRTPTLIAMTAAGMDFVSGGRFTLGLGASGPQVIEGFHGVPYDSPLARTRETIEICRRVWAREALQHSGEHYCVPLDRGPASARPLKLINHPVRPRIPIHLAALGPRNVELAAELADGWQPIFLAPERLNEVWGEALSRGKAQRSEELNPLHITARMSFAIGDDAEDLVDLARPKIALYVGGMGSRERNFYNELAQRYGYEDEARQIQNLFLAGRQAEAAAAVPAALVHDTSLIGTTDQVTDRLRSMRAAGITQIDLEPLRSDRTSRIEEVAALCRLIADVATSPTDDQ